MFAQRIETFRKRGWPLNYWVSSVQETYYLEEIFVFTTRNHPSFSSLCDISFIHYKIYLITEHTDILSTKTNIKHVFCHVFSALAFRDRF